MKKIDYYKLFPLYIKMGETTYVKKKNRKKIRSRNYYFCFIHIQ